MSPLAESTTYMTTEVATTSFEVEARCSDGRVYKIRPMAWDLEEIEKAWKRWKNYEILSDDVPSTLDGFTIYVTGNGAIWFEVVDEQGDQVGLVYLSELIPSLTTGRYISCQFHATIWDAKIGPRIELARAFIIRIIQVFGFHRIQCEIPLRFGGAIRVMKRIGFKEEGILRSARRYHGEWYNVLLFGLIENEVEEWARSSHQAR